MTLLSLIIALIVVGAVLWLLDYLPLDAAIKQIIRGLVILVVVIWLITHLLPLGSFGTMRIGH